MAGRKVGAGDVAAEPEKVFDRGEEGGLQAVHRGRRVGQAARRPCENGQNQRDRLCQHHVAAHLGSAHRRLALRHHLHQRCLVCGLYKADSVLRIKL